jgi:hypothetical protein
VREDGAVDEELTLEDVAVRAGVSPGFAHRLANAKVIDPEPSGAYGVGAVRRAMLVSACVQAGLPLAGIAEAIETGHLSLDPVDAPYYDRWGERGDRTWEQLAAETGVPLSFIRAAYEAVGWGPPEPNDHPRVDGSKLVAAMSLPPAAGFGEEGLLRLFRVYGEGLRRITRSETAMWHGYIDVPLERGGASQREVLDSGWAFGEAIMSVIDESMLTMYHRMQEHAWMHDLVEHIELALVEAGVYSKPERPGRWRSWTSPATRPSRRSGVIGRPRTSRRPSPRSFSGPHPNAGAGR